MVLNPRPLRILLIAALLAAGLLAHAQSTPPPINPAISRLAARIAEPLQKARATRVVVADLLGPDGQTHPLGKYLPDQLTVSLQKDFPNLQVIDRPPQETILSAEAPSGNADQDLRKLIKSARKLGANAVITGSFAKVSQEIGVTLSPEFCNESRRSFTFVTGLIPITDELTAVSPDPIPSPKDGIAKAGTGGTTLPRCIYCPDPLYSPKARAAKYQGSVVLDVIVNAQGQAEQITVVKSPGMGLDENTIQAVKKWKFKPAVGPDGKPVAVRVPIETSFRFF